MVTGSEYLFKRYVYVLWIFETHFQQNLVAKLYRVDRFFRRLSLAAKRTEIVCLAVLTWDCLQLSLKHHPSKDKPHRRKKLSGVQEQVCIKATYLWVFAHGREQWHRRLTVREASEKPQMILQSQYSENWF